MLTLSHKQQHIEGARDFLELYGDNKGKILDRIETGDKTWPYREPDLKLDSVQWHKKGAAPLKMFRVSHSSENFKATVFWETKGTLMMDY